MMDNSRHLIGLIINPISGMGGAVGLKGTDGAETLQKAVELGAIPFALKRAEYFLKELNPIKSKLMVISCPGEMGEKKLNSLEFTYKCVSHALFNDIQELSQTSAAHTIAAARIMREMEDLELIVFIGGDGTARDILSAIKLDKPCLGVPSGVKVYSSCFSLNPKNAANLVMQYLWGEIPLQKSEVLDINEEEYRNGRLVSKIFGHLLTPSNPNFSQNSKMGTPHSDLSNQQRIARRIVEMMEEDTYYLIGPGTTTKAITDVLGQEKTVLGVDLALNGKIIECDLNEERIIESIRGKKAKIITSLIGRQGFLFGRGNLQFSPKVLKTIGVKNIIIISTVFKMTNIPNQVLRIDTRDPELDEAMKGLYKIVVDYDQEMICMVN
ncbi:MAG: ATP-NAD kinase family protein [Candidatus Lokiarchaeota archaeon]|nr:ATP-NAD kinase family protein [Candidatus Lokiarchaeota archaeon]